jgi:hypothetical protein
MVELPVSMYKDYLTAPDEDNALKLHSGLSGKDTRLHACEGRK